MSARLDAPSDLFTFFHARTLDAHAEVGVALSDDTLLYVAKLLAERARADAPSLPEETLAELYGRAHRAPPGAQARAYRELGDRALLRLGWFQESLRRSPVGPGYYHDMGSSAYHRVDQVFKRWFADAFGPVFRELADTFDGCVALVGHVADRCAEDDPTALLRLIEQWRRTGSEAAARRLRARHVPLSLLDPA